MNVFELLSFVLHLIVLTAAIGALHVRHSWAVSIGGGVAVLVVALALERLVRARRRRRASREPAPPPGTSRR